MARPLVPPPTKELLDDLLAEENPSRAIEKLGKLHSIGPTPTGKWLHWDKLHSLAPPDGLSSREWWLGVSLSRGAMFKELPLLDVDGNALRYATPDQVQELLHYVDQHSSGAIAMPQPLVNDEAAQRHYLVNSLMEEAIRSSQLEGATTTRMVAKELIRSGRKPKDRSERMILNNYNAMMFMRDELGDHLTPEGVIELQRILTEGTLDNPDAAGRLQTPDEERVVVWDSLEARMIHQPPAASELPSRLQSLCDFANGEQVEGFLHPVLRAIMLHYQLAYDHPFEDGNGRTSRALFYWSMRKQGYWLTEYLSISQILRKAPSKYYRSFLYTQTDGGDITYFFIHHLEVVKRAIEEFHHYIERKLKEVQEVERFLRGRRAALNHRQLALLSNAVRSPEQRYTYLSHARSHAVSHEAARHDLLQLVALGYLEQNTIGRRYTFRPVPDLAGKLQEEPN